VTQKLKILFAGVKWPNNRARMLGVTLSGKANREAPAQPELRPTCAGTFSLLVNPELVRKTCLATSKMSKLQRALRAKLTIDD
jgi:hypothetical protein